jgi:hypothetical protein
MHRFTLTIDVELEPGAELEPAAIAAAQDAAVRSLVGTAGVRSAFAEAATQLDSGEVPDSE